MTEYKYGKINRLNKSLIKNGIDNEICQKIMESGETIKTGDKTEKKEDWFLNSMNVMDDLLDGKIKQKVREECACNLKGKRQIMCKELFEKNISVEEKIEEINKNHYVFGKEIKIIGKGTYEVTFWDESMQVKPCACWGHKNTWHLNKKMSSTYCLCCGGHIKHFLEILLGKRVEVVFISSALSSNGEKNCRFQLKEIKEK